MLASVGVVQGAGRKNLEEGLIFLPLDFIRGLDLDGHRKSLLDRYLDPIPEARDLRFRAQVRGGGMYSVIAEVLEWDTEFFGYGVGKLHTVIPEDGAEILRVDLCPLLNVLLERAREKCIRYLFTQVDPRELGLIRALGSAGFALIETRAYYSRPLKDFDYPHRFDVRVARAEDVPPLSEVAATTVNAYDRFHADPFIDPVDADRMMREWVRASIESSYADVTIVPNAEAPAAFCTVKYHRNSWDAWKLKLSQPVLSAVSPEARGWYLKLISEVLYHLKDAGAEHAFLATQVNNKAVIRVWEKLGFQFGRCEHIFRKIILIFLFITYIL